VFVYRLTTRKYAEKLDGVGASLYNNRWNSMGTPMIYTAENRALALAEIVIHLSAAALPLDYVMLEIKIPDTAKFEEISTDDLEPDWNSFPHKIATQKIGDHFIRSRKDLILKVPSAVVHVDFNILINPLHEGIEQIKIADIQSFPLDNRLF
jgi:RES domain-containing protein